MSTQQIDVQIMGQSYVLGCPEGGKERLLDAVHKVDEAMCKIRDAGKIKARERIAVLAALNLAFEQSQAQWPVLDPLIENTSATVSEDDHSRLNQLLQKLDNALEYPGPTC